MSILVWKSKFKKYETFFGIFNNLLPVAIATWKGVSMQIGLIWMCIFSIRSLPSFRNWIQNSVHMFSLLHLCTSFHTYEHSNQRIRHYSISSIPVASSFPIPKWFVWHHPSWIELSFIVVIHIFAHHIRTIRIYFLHYSTCTRTSFTF